MLEKHLGWSTALLMKHCFTDEALKLDLKQSNVAKCSNSEFSGPNGKSVYRTNSGSVQWSVHPMRTPEVAEKIREVKLGALKHHLKQKIMHKFHRWEQDIWLLNRGICKKQATSARLTGRHSAATQKTQVLHWVSRWITHPRSVGTRNRCPALGHWQLCMSRLHLSHWPKPPSAWSACASSL